MMLLCLNKLPKVRASCKGVVESVTKPQDGCANYCVITSAVGFFFFARRVVEKEHQSFLMKHTPNEFCPVRSFHSSGKMSEELLWFTGCQEWLHWRSNRALLDHRRNEEDFILRELSRPCLTLLSEGLAQKVLTLVHLHTVGQPPGWAAAGHSSHFTALQRPGCPWLHPQGCLIRSGRLIWHWKIECLLWNCGKNQDYLGCYRSCSVHFTWFQLPSSLVTPVTPIWGQRRKFRCKVKNRCQSWTGFNPHNSLNPSQRANLSACIRINNKSSSTLA